ncbi:MAG TPA: phosphoribosylanthranilate isomerase [Thermodesulfobacteriota bacterium]|nr:phosphoribosylanthranilate isomerase [Thermodesulfobacteriota bacterium]
MVSVKICGITNIRDAKYAVESGADALGFIFYPKSRRSVTPEKAKEIIQKIPGCIARIGVFVNEEIGTVKEIVSFCGLHLIQLHGDESPQYCGEFPMSSLIKTVSHWADEEIKKLEDYCVKAILVDAHDPGHYGGTGRNSDWALALKVKKIHPLILAGGLNRENIKKAIETVGPHGVDINSGVEASPGKKDPYKIREIVEIIRETDKDETSGNVFSEARNLEA